MTYQRRTALTALLSGAGLLAAGRLARAQSAAGKIVFAYPSDGLSMLPFYIAKDKGFFTEEKVTVDLVRVGAGNFFPALFSGQADVVFSSLIDPITLRQKGQDVIGIGLFARNSWTQFVFSKKLADAKGITSASPLAQKVAAVKGARIAVSGQGAGTDNLLRISLYKFGMDYKDLTVTYIKQGDAVLTALLNNQIDGFIHASPYYEMAIEKGAAIMLIDFAKGEVKEANYVQTALTSTGKIIAAKKAELIKFMRAADRGLTFVVAPEHREEVLTLASKYLTGGKSTNDQMRPYVEEVIANGQFPKSTLVEESDFDAGKNFRNTLLKLENQPPLTLSFREVVNTELATEAAQGLTR